MRQQEHDLPQLPCSIYRVQKVRQSVAATLMVVKSREVMPAQECVSACCRSLEVRNLFLLWMVRFESSAAGVNIVGEVKEPNFLEGGDYCPASSDLHFIVRPGWVYSPWSAFTVPQHSFGYLCTCVSVPALSIRTSCPQVTSCQFGCCFRLIRDGAALPLRCDLNRSYGVNGCRPQRERSSVGVSKQSWLHAALELIGFASLSPPFRVVSCRSMESREN